MTGRTVLLSELCSGKGERETLGASLTASLTCAAGGGGGAWLSASAFPPLRPVESDRYLKSVGLQGGSDPLPVAPQVSVQPAFALCLL